MNAHMFARLRKLKRSSIDDDFIGYENKQVNVTEICRGQQMIVVRLR
jgi:hypothetical protein